jgi:hypothetical protein
MVAALLASLSFSSHGMLGARTLACIAGHALMAMLLWRKALQVRRGVRDSPGARRSVWFVALIIDAGLLLWRKALRWCWNGGIGAPHCCFFKMCHLKLRQTAPGSAAVQCSFGLLLGCAHCASEHDIMHGIMHAHNKSTLRARRISRTALCFCA